MPPSIRTISNDSKPYFENVFKGTLKPIHPKVVVTLEHGDKGVSIVTKVTQNGIELEYEVKHEWTAL